MRVYTVIALVSFLFGGFLAAQDDNNGGKRRERLRKLLEQRRSQNHESTPLPTGVTTKLDIAYTQNADKRQKLDIYLPAQRKKKVPVLFHIHGGGWRMGDKKRMRDTGIFYASKGFLFVAPNYRLAPKDMHPAHVEDCASALAWTWKHAEKLGGDTKRIFVSGHSAGAHLAALLGTSSACLAKHDLHPERLAGVIPVDTAAFDLLSGNNEGISKMLIRTAFGTDKAVLKEASPFHNVVKQKRYPSFLVFITTNRSPAVVGESRKFTERLKAVGASARVVPVDNHTHREMATGMYDASDPVGKGILEFLQKKTKK